MTSQHVTLDWLTSLRFASGSMALPSVAPSPCDPSEATTGRHKLDMVAPCEPVDRYLSQSSVTAIATEAWPVPEHVNVDEIKNDSDSDSDTRTHTHKYFILLSLFNLLWWCISHRFTTWESVNSATQYPNWFESSCSNFHSHHIHICFILSTIDYLFSNIFFLLPWIINGS